MQLHCLNDIPGPEKLAHQDMFHVKHRWAGLYESEEVYP